MKNVMNTAHVALYYKPTGKTGHMQNSQVSGFMQK